MSTLLGAVVTVVVSVIASSGFWTYLQRGSDKNDAKTKLLLGLAHDRIVSIGTKYIDRGWVTYDEYEDFIKYLYAPYAVFGGNGLAEKIMGAVSELPMHTNNSYRVRSHKNDRRELATGSSSSYHDGPDV